MFKMLSMSSYFKNMCLNVDFCNFQSLQLVRWRRKPLWMPTAKSKLFRIPVRPQIPEEEKEELKRLFNNYRTQIKSIRRFLTCKYSEALQEQADTEQLKKDFDEDFARCTEINKKWNEELRKQREERVARELEKDVEFAKNRMAKLLLEKTKKLAEAEEIVKREKNLLSTFVTPENLDEIVLKALNSPVDYNFAIDLEGNKIFGRETKPEDSVAIKQ